jgi:hypothetical protein
VPPTRPGGQGGVAGSQRSVSHFARNAVLASSQGAVASASEAIGHPAARAVVRPKLPPIQHTWKRITDSDDSANSGSSTYKL